MEISRVCDLPSDSQDREHFMNLCDILFKTNRKSWIQDCLQRIPNQPVLKLKNFNDVVMSITREDRATLLDSRRQELISKPVSQWLSVINEFITQNPDMGRK